MNRSRWWVPVIALGLAWPVSSLAEPSVRMYKVNKKAQQSRIRLGDAAHEAGCHNLVKARKVYRFAQVDFAWCTLHSKNNCTDDFFVPVLWQGRDYRKFQIDSSQPQTKLYPGSNWFPQLEEGQVHSWYCEPG